MSVPLLMQHLAATLSMSSAVSIQCVFTLEGVADPVTVGASWARRERDEKLGSEDHIITDSTLRVPAHLLPREPRYKDKVSIGTENFGVEKTHRRGPVFLVQLSKRNA